MRKIWYISIVGIGIALGAWYLWDNYVPTYSHPHIKPYQPERDRAAILQLFEDNWEWLVHYFTPDEYSASYRLDYKAVSKKPGDAGRLNIDVYRTDGKTVGFIAYYVVNFYEGYILFLSVDHAYRGQGIAPALLSHAVKQLREKGVRVIEMVTRIDNYAAQRVYEKFGFELVKQDNIFNTYRYYFSDR